jgi:hypothetical protein
VAMMIVALAFASLFETIIHFIEGQERLKLFPKFICLVLIAYLILMTFDMKVIRMRHSLQEKGNVYSASGYQNKMVFANLRLPGNAVIFNVVSRHYIEAMFYTGLPAYNFIPSEEQYLDLKKKNRTIVIFRPQDNLLPVYLINDPKVIINENMIKSFD